MNVEAIGAIAAPQLAIAAPQLAAAQPLADSAARATGAGFGDLVSQGLGAVNRELMAGQTDLQGLAVGETQDLHRVMIGIEQARLDFQLLMQVRSRLLEAYQDVMRMQV